MAQSIVYDYLKEKRKLNDYWYSSKQIHQGLIKDGIHCTIQTISNDLLKLAQFNLIQCKGVGLWEHKKVFRAYKVTN
jgi:hypothetical protein